MTIPDVPGSLPFVGNPPLAFRFIVHFLVGGAVPNFIDILFQKVSGLGTTVNTVSVEEGGQNLYTQQLPTKVEHGNLVLERGLVTPSPLAVELNIAMTMFKFAPSNILISLLDNTYLPISTWLCIKAYPVGWSVSDLDARENAVVIETMEFTYQHLKIIRM